MCLSQKNIKINFLKHIFTYEDNNFSPILFYKPYETLVHKNMRIVIFLTVHLPDFF